MATINDPKWFARAHALFHLLVFLTTAITTYAGLLPPKYAVAISIGQSVLGLLIQTIKQLFGDEVAQ